MKKLSVILSLLLILSFTQVNAQSGNFSAGLVTTHFSNGNSDQQFANYNNPLGAGLLLGYQVRPDMALSLTAEYLNGDMKNSEGSENNFRTNLSAFFFPVQNNSVNPYVSAGVVMNFKNQNFDDRSDRNITQLQSRFGAGLDVPIISNLSLNLDFAAYITEIRYTGWAQSFGLRYTL